MRREQLHRQRQHVVAARAQRHQRERKYVQAVIEIFAEAPGGDFLAQAAVGGRDHAHIEAIGVRAAQALDLALLQNPQQLGLQRQRNLGDLIEQQGAALRLLELAGVRGVRAGEAPRSQPNSMASSMFSGNGGAIDRDEGCAARGEWRWM